MFVNMLKIYMFINMFRLIWLCVYKYAYYLVNSFGFINFAYVLCTIFHLLIDV